MSARWQTRKLQACSPTETSNTQLETDQNNLMGTMGMVKDRQKPSERPIKNKPPVAG